MLFRAPKLTCLVIPFSLLLACGEATPEAKTADAEPKTEREHAGGPAVSAEIGGLDEAKVEAVFGSTQGKLEACMAAGAQRVEFLGGDVAFFVKIGVEGKVEAAYLEKSTVGDRDTEKCMLDVLRARSWPKPVGGEHGLARKGFGFDQQKDVRAPSDYDQEHLDKGLSKIAGKIASCKNARGSYEATMYVATDGSVMAAGVTPPSEEGEDSVDCLVSTLKGASFPSPGSWPAKITFTL